MYLLADPEYRLHRGFFPFESSGYSTLTFGFIVFSDEIDADIRLKFCLALLTENSGVKINIVVQQKPNCLITVNKSYIYQNYLIKC